MKAVLLFAIAAISIAVLGLARVRAAEPTPAAYNTKVQFRINQPIAFPHFTLTYTGSKKSDPTPAGLHPWTIHEFTVTAKGREQKVLWTAGTGDIGPSLFNCGGVAFLLELSRSDTLGKLKEDEVVVRPKGKE